MKLKLIFRNSPYLFNAKEFDEETGLYYYGARYYDSRLAMWLGVDPMAEKYPNMGAYMYCANNPVKLVDPDGRKILFSQGSSEQFKKTYKAVVKTLKDKEVSKGLLELINSPRDYYIKETTEKNSYFNTSDMTIYWNPNIEVECENGYILTNVEVLNHEGGHGAEYDRTANNADKAFNEEWNNSHDKKAADAAHAKVWNEYKVSNKKDPNNPYGSIEEQRNISDVEQYTAQKLGQLNGKKVTRETHKGKVLIKNTNDSNETK